MYYAAVVIMNEVQTQTSSLLPVPAGRLPLCPLDTYFIFYTITFFLFFIPAAGLYRRAAGVCKLGETHAVCKTTNIRIIMFPFAPRAANISPSARHRPDRVDLIALLEIRELKVCSPRPTVRESAFRRDKRELEEEKSAVAAGF